MTAPASRPQSRPALVKAVVLAHDVASGALAMFLALLLRYSIAPASPVPYRLFPLVTGLFAFACLVVFALNGLHRGVWRFMALNDLLRIAYAVITANLVFLLALFLFNRLEGFPRSTVLIEGPLLVAWLSVARFARQVMANGDWRAVVRLEDRDRPAAILAGSDAALDAYLRDAARRPGGPPFRVRGLVAPEGAETGRAIHGVPVLGGPDAAVRALVSLSGMRGGQPQLVIVDPDLTRAQIETLVTAASEASAGLVRARADAPGALSPLDAADLLGRPPRRLDLASVRDLICGRRVLVTGAGGTIGSELARQVARLAPARLGLLDASEHALYSIDFALKEGGFDVEPYLGDVRDRVRMDEVMAALKPDIVLHAAALKHVPLMEANPVEAVLTNVLGTINVADAAKAAGAMGFVLISTDKAVNPTNVMGASKRAAELYVQALDAGDEALRACAVRFGNVLGSTGSVAPLFEHQIRKGGPITVTHPDITRYFMTTEEASALVLQAAALCCHEPERRGSVFVLDMGEPVKIEELARELCRLRGLEAGRDIAIVHTGLRPGEKLHEAIFYDDETVSPTEQDGVLNARAAMTPMAELAPHLEALLSAAKRRDAAALACALSALTPEFTR